MLRRFFFIGGWPVNETEKKESPTMLTTKELREKRVRLAEEARAIIDGAAKDKREALKSEEEEKWKAIHTEIDSLARHIEIRERQDEEERRLAEPQPRKTEAPQPSPGSSEPHRPAGRLKFGDNDAREALRGWFLAGSDKEPLPEHIEVAQRVGLDLRSKNIHLRLSPYPLKDLHRVHEWEERAQSTATGGAGGFTVPDETMRALEIALLQFGGMRAVANVLRTTSGADLPYPMTNDTAQKGEIIGQNLTTTQQDVVFTQLVLQAFKYSSKMILVSVEFLQDSSINVPAFLGEALGNRLGRITNEHFTTGDGSSKPQGIVVASTLGKTGASGQTTTVIYDDLVDLLHSVDPAYRASGSWMFHDATLKALKKIKTPQFSGDTAGMPLWAPGLASREPDTILGYPYVVNQDMAVMAASAKSILFGDLSKYLIRDVVDMTLLRLDERFAEFHQVAFLAYLRSDGDLLNAGTNPVKHYINAAS
jgi:HK97 family phage major capsid protein